MVATEGTGPGLAGGERATAVLESALTTFSRQGYRRTSMEDVARDARISRPGLYLYFSSKPALFRAAVDHALARDVVAAEALLAAADEPLGARLLAALDLWAGQYAGPLAADLEGLLERDAALLGDLPEVWSARFRSALVRALTEADEPGARAALHSAGGPDAVCEVVLALVSGTKHRSMDRTDFRVRLGLGLGLVLR